MTLLNAYIGDTVFRLRGIRALNSVSHTKKDLKEVITKTLEKNTYARPDMNQLFRYPWFRDSACFERVKKLVHMHTGKLLNLPDERWLLLEHTSESMLFAFSTIETDGN